MAHSPLLWRTPTTQTALSSNELHLWRAELDVTKPDLTRFDHYVSSQERAQAKGLPAQHLRTRYIAHRGILRLILARYLGEDPQKILFQPDTLGKPRLAHPFDAQKLYFSSAHSQGLALYAISSQPAVGVDVERVRPITQAPLIASQFFTTREHQQWRRLPLERQTLAFFACWTRKEAYCKAVGTVGGTPSHLPKQVEVSLMPEHPATILSVYGNPRSAAPWVLHSLEPATGYLAAVAARQATSQLRCWQWDPVRQ